MTIAGHTFPLSDLCACGVHWLRIKDCDKSYVGQMGYAHYGNLSAIEQTEIEAEKARREKAAEDAMGYVYLSR